ncbi:MAG TPA: UDP-N-acetylglucosamine 2-epimerase (non-hydrolyzing) [Thermoanaerobaculia bacterium]
MTSQRILVVVGTRPEAIKLAPVVQRLQAESALFEVVLTATGQHREMLGQALEVFRLRPDIDLDLMRPDQSPSEIAGRAFGALDPLLVRLAPDWLLIQGDTTTAMCAAIAAFHRRVRVGHVEAGLRTGDLRAPFPEEMNRRVADIVSEAFFAPTGRAAAALRAEGAPENRIYLTGNTVVDALQERAAADGPATPEDLVLITVHRRESFGAPLSRVVRAVARLARTFPATRFLHIVHPNPNVATTVRSEAASPNLQLVDSLDYRSLIHRLRRCRLILTDSGGIQEEAPAFGKPVLVLREKTERPEGVEAGLALLVGTDEDRIVHEATRLLTDPEAYRRMSEGGNPYGDGKAAGRIVDVLAGRPFSAFRAALLSPTPA